MAENTFGERGVSRKTYTLRGVKKRRNSSLNIEKVTDFQGCVAKPAGPKTMGLLSPLEKLLVLEMSRRAAEKRERQGRIRTGALRERTISRKRGSGPARPSRGE